MYPSIIGNVNSSKTEKLILDMDDNVETIYQLLHQSKNWRKHYNFIKTNEGKFFGLMN